MVSGTFRGQEHRRLCGEKSNSYMDVPEARERIKEKLPQTRLIAQLAIRWTVPIPIIACFIAAPRSGATSPSTSIRGKERAGAS